MTAAKSVKTDSYRKLVGALRALMAANRDERESYLQAAAEEIVAQRGEHVVDGIPDWGGTRSGAYRALIRAAYREAGVPPDSEETIQASLRYHVGGVVRRIAPPAELKALGLKSESPAARQRRSPKAPPPVTENPNATESRNDSADLVVEAIRLIEEATALQPRGRDAVVVQMLLRTLRKACDDLATATSAPATPSRRTKKRATVAGDRTVSQGTP